jgi:glycosyltransferase involved in cell wall biosynthesis
MMHQQQRPIHIGILSHEFLVNIGANDFLKNIIRGLALESQNKVTFLCPRSNEKIEPMTPAPIKATLNKVPYLRQVLRYIIGKAGPVTDRIIKTDFGEYAFYAEACPNMEFIECAMDEQSLARIKAEKTIDVFLPSIHILPTSLPHVTYWPDCQPKHYPEFFDDESQRVRDERITGLLKTKKPKIINSRNAKSDMVRFYNADPDQIYELPFAPIIEFSKLTPRPEMAAPYNLSNQYFIVCNQFWVHKSTETVIEAAAIARQRGLKVDFVFTGRMEEPRRPGYIDSLHQLVNDLDVGDVVRFLGYIPKDDQLELIKGAVAVIQPSLFEGGPGGGAVYDAMSLGIRAIVSDIPINHELPLEPGRLALFKKKNAHDLVDKMEDFLSTQYQAPSSEDLYQQSRLSTELLSKRLYEAIDYTLSLSQE